MLICICVPKHSETAMFRKRYTGRAERDGGVGGGGGWLVRGTEISLIAIRDQRNLSQRRLARLISARKSVFGFYVSFFREPTDVCREAEERERKDGDVGGMDTKV